MQERLLFNANNRWNSCRTSQFSIDGIVQCRRRRYGKEQVYPSQIPFWKRLISCIDQENTVSFKFLIFKGVMPEGTY